MLRFNKYQTSKKLLDYIQYYFVIDLNSDVGTDSEDQFLSNHPQGTVDLMFALKGGINLTTHKGDLSDLNNIFVMAQQEGFFNIQFKPESYIIGVVFYAESFKKLFNFPMVDLKNTGTIISDQVGNEYHELLDQMSRTRSELTIPAQLDGFFEQQLAKVDFNMSDMDKLISQIRHYEGTVNLEDLAFDANVSVRTLQRRMKEITGLGVKGYSQVLRFKKVLQLINANPMIDWQDILFQTGYFDQAHFIKDFKRYTGKTPSEFVEDDINLSNLFLKE